MATIEELRERWGAERFSPDINCSKCHGEGEYLVRGVAHPCLCIYVENKEDVGWLSELIDKAFKEVLGDNYEL